MSRFLLGALVALVALVAFAAWRRERARLSVALPADAPPADDAASASSGLLAVNVSGSSAALIDAARRRSPIYSPLGTRAPDFGGALTDPYQWLGIAR